MDAINIRRTVRDFSADQVPYDIVKRALQAGLKAPSYNHQKQWDFILVKDKDIRLKLTKTEEMKDKVDEDLKKRFEMYDTLERSKTGRKTTYRPVVSIRRSSCLHPST